MGRLAADIAVASSSAVIVAPYASAKAVEILGGPLNDAMRRGVEVTCVVAKRVTDEVRASFAKTGVALTEDESATCPGLAVLDRRRIWYGTFPLLAFPQADDCSIRFESAEAAHDLLEGLSPGQRGEATDRERPERAG